MEINSVGVMICNKHELKQMIKQNSVEVFVHPIKASIIEKRADGRIQ